MTTARDRSALPACSAADDVTHYLAAPGLAPGDDVGAVVVVVVVAAADVGAGVRRGVRWCHIPDAQGRMYSAQRT
jgi:hypothetical protein